MNCLFNTSLFLFLILTCFLSEITSHLIAFISFSAPPSWYLCSVVFRAMGKMCPHSYDFSMTWNSICNLCGSMALKQQWPSCTNMPLCLTSRGPMETPCLLKAIDFIHGQPSLSLSFKQWIYHTLPNTESQTSASLLRTRFHVFIKAGEIDERVSLVMMAWRRVGYIVLDKRIRFSPHEVWVRARMIIWRRLLTFASNVVTNYSGSAVQMWTVIMLNL